ncbi:MAG: Cof-type HAD-IIB family hydrolase [Streptococcaceae bacterium]|jgi:peptidyl-prolyl cis-trans isomerase B (cyclophilin B)|nr:Cof-type HAD-IIB family hydrolase [Streptococcaceae bacterium]
MENLREKAKNIKIIFFDIDDTLRAKDTAFMPESVAMAFEKLRQNGILTGIATGRNLYGVIPEVRALKPDFYVTANGAYVEDKNENIIYDQHYNTDFVEKQIEWLKSVNSDYVFYGNHAVAISKWTDLAQSALEPVYGEIPEDPDFYKKNSVYQLVSISDHDDQIKLPEKFADEVRMVRWHPNSSDILPRIGSKAIGVEKVLESLGLMAENLMNFGDELNDRELFDFSGLSVAMKVSHPEILEKADYVTDTVENDGIYKALIELGIIE